MISFFKSHSYLSSLVCSFLLLLFFGLFSLFEAYQANEVYKENLMKNKEVCSKEESGVPDSLCELIFEEDDEMAFAAVMEETFTFQYSYFSYLLPLFVFVPIMIFFRKKRKFSKEVFFSVLLYPTFFSFLFSGCLLIIKNYSEIDFVSYFVFGNFVSVLYGFFYLFLGSILFFKFQNLGVSIFGSYIFLFILEFFLKWLSLSFGAFSFLTFTAYSEIIGAIFLTFVSFLCFFVFSKK